MTQLTVGLAKRGWSLRVYCGQPVYQNNEQTGANAPTQEVYEGVDIVRVGALGSGQATLGLRVWNWLTLLFGIMRHVWRDRKLLSGVINTTNPAIMGVVALFAKWVAGIPYVTIVHDVYPDVAVQLGVLRPQSLITRGWSLVNTCILRQSRGVVVLGRDMLALIRDKMGAESAPIVVIPNWADPTSVYFVPFEQNSFAQQHNPDKQFVVQYAGRMGRTHNLDVLLDSAEILRHHPIRFQLIGAGAKRAHLLARAQQQQLTNVQFLPYQPFEALSETLSAADLAVVCLDDAHTGVSVPSKTYGVMACGRPILALLNPDSEIGRTVTEAQCGIVLPNATGETIANRIHMLTQDQAQQIEMQTNSYRAFQAQFTLDTAVEAYDKQLTEWLKPAPQSRAYAVFSRLLDLTFALLGLLPLFCILPLVWVINRLTAPGPLFYWQTRVGLDGKLFEIAKLRSMVVDAEAGEAQWAEAHDVRVTKIGRILRQTHLDELPQAYNILRGQMRLIGPRPERPEFTAVLAQELPDYDRRHQIKPGITGWAQVNQMYSASIEDSALKLSYDLHYVVHQSWRLDLRILTHTIKLIIGRRGR
ncbi:MAG: sugar transferase [Candidatus Promineifilaceae bacterium]